jgi:hypothetical protein
MIGFTGTSLQLQSITTAHNQWLSMTRSIPYRTTSSFFSNDEPWITDHALISSVLRITTPVWASRDETRRDETSLMLRPTVCLGIKHTSGAYDQICVTVRQMRVHLCMFRPIWSSWVVNIIGRGMDCIHLARVQWRARVNTVMHLWASQNVRKFLRSWTSDC